MSFKVNQRRRCSAIFCGCVPVLVATRDTFMVTSSVGLHKKKKKGD